MNLLDLRERLGPYWAAYQARRRRDDIFEDPDYVPPWFLGQLARDRVVAARVGVEHAGKPNDFETEQLWNALRLIEERLRSHDLLDGVTEQLVCGLLGAQEIETERERRWAQDEERRRDGGVAAVAGERYAKSLLFATVAHLRARGVRTSSDLAALHADQDAETARMRALDWQALDLIADETREFRKTP